MEISEMGRAVLRKYRRILTRFWNRYNSELVAYTELLEQSFNLGVLKKKKKTNSHHFAYWNVFLASYCHLNC